MQCISVMMQCHFPAQVLAAVEQVKASGIEIEDVSVDSFRLPTIAARLHRMQEEITSGRGFALIRGLPVQDMTMM